MNVVVGLILMCGGLAAVCMAWRLAASRALVLCPLAAFVATEIRSVWPANLSLLVSGSGGLTAVLVSSVALIAFCLSFVIISSARKGASHELLAFRSSGVEADRGRLAYQCLILVMASGLVVLGSYQYRGAPPIAASVSSLLQGGESDFDQLNQERRALTKGYIFGADEWRGQGLIAVLLNIGWLYLGVLVAALRHKYRTTGWLLTLIGVVIAGLVYVGGVGERAPMVELVAGVLVAVTVLRVVQWRQVLIGMVVMSLVVFVVGPIKGQFTDGGSPTAAALATLSRIAFGNGANNVLIVESIGDGSLELGLGALHWEKLDASLPGVGGASDAPFANRLANMRDPNSLSTSYATPTNLGFVYADFGALGLIASYSAYGFCCAFGQARLLRLRKSPENVAVFVLISSAFASLSFGTVVAFGVALVFALSIHLTATVLLRVIGRRPWTRHQGWSSFGTHWKTPELLQ